MSLSSVKQFFAIRAADIQVVECGTSTATVALAAQALDVAPGFRTGEAIACVLRRLATCFRQGVSSRWDARHGRLHYAGLDGAADRGSMGRRHD